MDVMHKLIILSISVVLSTLIGCQPSELDSLEKKHQLVIKQGQLNEQLLLLDQLIVLAPNKYQELIETKKYLDPLLQRFNANTPKEHSLTEDDVRKLIKFSPNYQPFKQLRVSQKKRKNLLAKITSIYQEIASQKISIKNKLTPTPEHIKTKNTLLSLSKFPKDKLNSQFFQNLFKVTSTASLNDYQLESLLSGMSIIGSNNILLKQKQEELNELDIGKLTSSILLLTEENDDIEKIFVWLHQQQLKHSYGWIKEQSLQLQALVRMNLGKRRLDEFWQQSFEPLAKKSVLKAKQHHLALLKKISNYAKTIPITDNLARIHYQKTLLVNELLIALLWPMSGLYEFKQQSEQSDQELQKLL